MLFLCLLLTKNIQTSVVRIVLNASDNNTHALPGCNMMKPIARFVPGRLLIV